MLYLILIATSAVAALYFLYHFVFVLYYYYFYYKSIGVPSLRFPVPMVGNLLEVQKMQKTITKFKWTVHEEYWKLKFGSRLPPIFCNFYGPVPVLVINDPDIVNEIYVTKNKYVDKSEKFGRVIRRLFGDSILFSPSDEKWAEKRKHLSSAFYKDKLSQMMERIVMITNQQVHSWRDKYAGQKVSFDIVQGCSVLLMECVL
jgi:cytochrome P450